jgi:hypothetical protein
MHQEAKSRTIEGSKGLVVALERYPTFELNSLTVRKWVFLAMGLAKENLG